MKKKMPKKNKKKIIFKLIKRTMKKKKIERKKFKQKFIIKFCIIFILIALYMYQYILDKNKIPLEQYQANVLPEIKSFENNLNLNQQIFDEFRKINSENKLIEEKPNFKKSNNPDISVVMTMYNQAHCIYKGLRSVQNQSFKNIEIIIVDDCSEDNSTDVIKEYQKEDPRIILISHDTNEGEIKTRTDGIGKAKGKYITIIDGDDSLIHKDVLKNSFFIAKKAKLDAVEFLAKGYRRGKPEHGILNYGKREYPNIIYQPELITKFTYTKGNYYELYINNIWAKLIKNEVFKKAIKYIGTEFTDDYINENEDVIMAVSLFRTAKSYYVMKEIGYYYSHDEKHKGFPKTKIGKCKVNNKLKKFGQFKVCKFLVDKNNDNDKEKSMAISYMKREILHQRLYQIQLDDRHYKILFHIFNKMLEWNCWTAEQRDYIIKQQNFVITSYKKKYYSIKQK